VPKTFHAPKPLDTINGKSKWHDAISLELLQIDEYNTFADIGHSNEITAPEGYKKIRVHLAFDVKHDERHRADLWQMDI
jgi:hypothetical protein